MNRKRINLLKYILYRQLGKSYINFYIILSRNYDEHKFYFEQF